MKTDRPQPLVPKLRFPEFAKISCWRHATIDDLIETVTPPKKIPSASYLKSGQFPIIDQSQNFICGWTNDEQAIIKQPLPVIVFGDHTCVHKFVVQPFAQGADGIKIILSKFVLTAYVYYYLSHISFLPKQYKRHFTELKNKVIWYPDAKSEQQKIADFLGSIDDLITVESQKLEALKRHKKGLMQQLFPQPGKTMPKLRFPEFTNSPQWKISTFGERCESFSGGTPDTSNENYYNGTIPFIRSAEIGCDDTAIFLTKEGMKNSAAKTVKRGDLLVALYGANSGDTALARMDGVINQAVMCIQSTENIPYLYHYLTAKKKWIITTYLQGGQGNLSGQIVLSVPLSIPHREEQQKIADCLGSLDDLITAMERKIKTIRQHKKGLMQQIFPSLDTE